jgi:spore germination protein GerM
MRGWLTSLTVGALALLILGALAYTQLSRRVGELERHLAERPSGTAVLAPASAPPVGTKAEPGRREVSVFFTRLQGQETQMAPAPRTVPAETPAAGALRALLAGPTPEEKARGLLTEIPPGTKLRKLVLEGGKARASFSEELDRDVAGAARVTTIRRQIEQTLRQFPEVDEVVIEVDGHGEDVLQP